MDRRADTITLGEKGPSRQMSISSINIPLQANCSYRQNKISRYCHIIALQVVYPFSPNIYKNRKEFDFAFYILSVILLDAN